MLEGELMDAVTEIWTKQGEDEGAGVEEGGVAVPLVEGDTWARRMEELEKKRRVNVIERVPRPEIGKREEWKMRLYRE